MLFLPDFFLVADFQPRMAQCLSPAIHRKSLVPSYTFEEKSSMRASMVQLISDVQSSKSIEEMTEHSVYAFGFLSTLPDDNVCTDEEAAEWKFQLQQAKDQATERLENYA